MDNISDTRAVPLKERCVEFSDLSFCTSQLKKLWKVSDGELKRIFDYCSSESMQYVLNKMQKALRIDANEDSLKSLSKIIFANFHLDSKIAEIVLATVVALRGVKSLSGAISIIYLSLQAHFKKDSLFNIIRSFLSEFFAVEGVADGVLNDAISGFQAQALFGVDFSSFLDSLESMCDNLSRLRDIEFSKKFLWFFSYIFSMFICDSDCKYLFTSEGFSLFKKHIDITYTGDFFINLFRTAVYLCKKFYLFFSRPSSPDVSLSEHVRNLVMEDSDLEKFDADYVHILSCAAKFESDGEDVLRAESKFDVCLSRCVEKVKLLTRASRGPTKEIYVAKHLKLLSVQRSYVEAIKRCNIRSSPFSMLVSGTTSVMKTSVVSLLSRAVLANCGFEPGDNFMSVATEGDAYHSSYRSSDLAVYFDDLGNEKPGVTGQNPHLKVIQFINNAPQMALSPIADLKGTIPICPRLVSASTNVPDLGANYYSQEPASILRRFKLHINVRVKPEYCIPGTGMFDTEAFPNLDIIHDYWIFDVYTVNTVQCGEVRLGAHVKTPYRWVLCKDGDELMQGISLDRLIHFATKKAKIHYAAQARLVRRISSASVCEHGSYSPLCHHCQQSELPFYEAQSGDTQFAIERITCYYQTSIVALNIMQLFLLFTGISICFASALYSLAMLCISLPFVYYFVVYLRKVCLKSFVRDAVDIGASEIERVVKQRRDEIYMSIKSLWAWDRVFLISLVCYCLYRVYRTKQTFFPEGNVMSVPRPKENERKNVWKTYDISMVPVSVKSATTTYNDLVVKASKFLAEATINRSGSFAQFRVFPIKSCFWLFPRHVLFDGGSFLEGAQVVLTRGYGNACNLNFSTTLSERCYVAVEGLDLAILYIPEGGPQPDFLDFFPRERALVCFGQWITRDSGGLEKYSVRFDPTHVEVKGVGHYPQHVCSLPRTTAKGMCGALAVVDAKQPYILGFHLAGEGTSALIGQVLRSDLDVALQLLSSRSGVVNIASVGTYQSNRLGKTVEPQAKVHPKSPWNFMSDDPLVECIGSHNERRTFHSEVVDSVISKSLARHLKMESKWGKPKRMNSYIHWQRFLDAVSHVSKNVDYVIFHRAYDDFHDHIFDFLTSHEELKKDIHPVPLEVAMNGVDGVYGIDSIKLSTSVGWPINKPKRGYVHEAEPLDGISCNRQPDAIILEEIKRIEDTLLSGERCYVVHRCNLKDEPTKLTKDKVRVFAGGEFAFLLCVRKYFITIFKMIMENHLLFECAVGVNAYGREWSELSQYMNRFGSERCIAGDYKSYDTSMSSVFTVSAFSILIDIAAWAGYDSDQLIIMRGLATEICYPLYEMNGDFILAYGSNPSGHPATVFINNICNSLYLRYSYYSIYRDRIATLPCFSDVVSVVCYGDDNKMTVHCDYPEFNHTTIVEALSNLGVVYTMADKESLSVPYIHSESASFLKRFSVWDEEWHLYLAPIEISSIYKSLFSHKRSKVLGDRELISQSIVSAITEFMLHGRSVYEKHAKILNDIVDEHNLRHFVGPIGDYDKCRSIYFERYLS